MSYIISKRFEFSAAHHLPHLPVHHKCARPHGHNYVVTVALGSDALDGQGFVEDYGQLDDVKSYIDGYLDHRDLNEVFEVPTTAENLARLLFERFTTTHPAMCEVRVSETPKTSASYRP